MIVTAHVRQDCAACSDDSEGAGDRHCSRCGADFTAQSEAVMHECSLSPREELRYRDWYANRQHRAKVAGDPSLRNRRRRIQRKYRGSDPYAPFVGVDGEGGYAECTSDACDCGGYRPAVAEVTGTQCACGHLAETHNHVYLLLRAGENALETGGPLTAAECLGFLASLDPSNIYVAYAFNYDVTMICRELPEHKIRKLMDRDKPISKGGRKPERSAIRRPLPVDWGPFELDYIPGKMFKVRHACTRHSPRCTNKACTENGACLRPGKHVRHCPNCPRWVEVNDVFSFFGVKFGDALRDWEVGSSAQREAIATGKGRRSTFTAVLDDETREYNRLEIDLLQELMSKFRAQLDEVGHLPTRWQGPGAIAETLLRDHRIPRKTQLPLWPRNGDGKPSGNPLDDNLLYAANYAYFGGRFETASIGQIPGPVYAYDINSAYPHALSQAPCLVHGRWVESARPESDLYISRGEYAPRHPSAPQPSFYGFPYRESGKIEGFGETRYAGAGTVSWIGRGLGYYWSMEIQASSKHQRFRNFRTWSYIRECDCRPFDWIPALYEARRRMGKSHRGKVLKLALVSLYGKMCQRAGSGPYNNYIWSSFITSYVRARLLDFIHSLPGCLAGQCGSDVHMLATDAVYADTLPPGFTATKELGGWDMEVHPSGLFVVQSGVYFGSADEPKEKTTKTRGVSQNRLLEYEGELRRE